MEGNDHKTAQKDISALKKEIRKQLLMVRASIEEGSRAEYDSVIFNKIISLKEYEDTNLVLTYASYNGEADTYRLIKRALDDGKMVACPVCDMSRGEPLLDFYRILSTDDLREGYKGIPEPDKDKCIKLSDEDISKAFIIVPLVGYDSDRNRLGYGKGFYDRFLARHEYSMAVGIAYSCQRCEKLPVDEYDVKPDVIITEV